MTILVGVDPQDSEHGSLALGGFLAAATGESLLVVTVVPIPRLPEATPGDPDYRQYVASSAQETLKRAKDAAPSGVDVSFMTVHARSTGSGLVQAAHTGEARMIVVGSADGGAYGRISTGSVSGRLLHSSPLPVALAVRGDDLTGAHRVARLSVAYAGGEDDPVLLQAAREARIMGAPLRVLFIALTPRPGDGGPPQTGSSAGPEAAWSERILADARRAAGTDALDVTVEVLRGYGWRESVGAAAWVPQEVLAIGASRGSANSVFLGSRAAKILRHSPVPVIAFPGRRG